MEIISVTGDLSVEYGSDQWRLVHLARPLIIANRAGMVFDPSYAARVRLETTTLRVERMAWIALEWDSISSRWQMGMMLFDESAQPSLRHGLLAWPPSAEYRYAEDAWKVADALAGVLGVPLRVNTTEQVAEVAQVVESANNPVHTFETSETRLSQPTEPLYEPVAEQKIKLRPLPLEMGKWVLRVSGGGLRWEATQSWMFSYALRTLFFLGAFVVFVVLGIGSRTSGLAPVTPEWLPFMAFGIGAVLAYSAIENLWSMLTPGRVVLDDLKQEIRSERALTGIVEWRVPYQSVQYLLVSQEKARSQGRRSSDDPMLISQDAWVHLCANDEFYLMGEVENVMGKSWKWEGIREREPGSERYPLSLEEYDTNLHHAVQHLAENLSIPAYVDLR